MTRPVSLALIQQLRRHMTELHAAVSVAQDLAVPASGGDELALAALAHLEVTMLRVSDDLADVWKAVCNCTPAAYCVIHRAAPHDTQPARRQS